jgi:hypothetical protein
MSESGGIWVRFLAGERDFSLLHIVRTAYEAQPAFYSRGTAGFISGGTAGGRGGGGRKMDNQFHLLPRSLMVERNLHSAIYLYEMEPN